jgi:hypothetical protein
MNKYVKVKGHTNWFLVLSENDFEPEGLSENMQEKILRTEVVRMHDPKEELGWRERLVMAATREIDYEALSKKYGTILIRPIGSFMPLRGNEITHEVYDKNFPIEEFGEIVICENDQRPEWNWVKYLKKTYPDKKIVTINYFDLRSEHEIKQYFDNAKLITFSTTFSDLGWFTKLTKLMNSGHQVIGHCHDTEKWESALKINPSVKIVDKEDIPNEWIYVNR